VHSKADASQLNVLQGTQTIKSGKKKNLEVTDVLRSVGRQSVVSVESVLCCCNLQELSATLYFMMGALAKMAATFVTYPIQLVQSRLRVSPHSFLAEFFSIV